jgi:endonuclease-3
MIQFGREYCKARKPACLDGEGPEACPLYDLCERVGINEMDGTVVDPEEADIYFYIEPKHPLYLIYPT